MTIETKQDGGALVLAVSGRLDAVTVSEYEKAVRGLIEGGATRLVADLDQLEYVSSAGLGQLIVTLKLIKEKGGQFCIANVHGNVLSVFNMCGIGRVIDIHPSVADAVAALS